MAEDFTIPNSQLTPPVIQQPVLPPESTISQSLPPTNKMRIFITIFAILIITCGGAIGSYIFLKSKNQAQQPVREMEAIQEDTQEDLETSSNNTIDGPIDINLSMFSSTEFSMPTTVPITGSLISGIPTELTIDIDQSTEAIFYLSALGLNLDFVLISPSGKVINPEYATKNSSEVEYESSGGSPESPPATSYSIKTPELGKWKAKITAKTNVEFKLVVFFDKGMALQADFDKKMYEGNAEAVIAARIVKSEGEVSISKIYASIGLPDNTTIKVDLKDVGNGIYAAKYRTPNTSGYLEAEVNVSGTNKGYSFNRSTIVLGQVNARAVILTDTYSENVIDKNNDGRFDALNFTLQLEALKNSEVGIQVELYGSNGKVIAQRGDFFKLNKGKQDISLQFSGQDIFKSGINGPYEIKRIYIIPIDTGIASDSRENTVLKTKPYSFSNFSAQ